jgi:hypothetical protein
MKRSRAEVRRKGMARGAVFSVQLTGVSGQSADNGWRVKGGKDGSAELGAGRGIVMGDG